MSSVVIVRSCCFTGNFIRMKTQQTAKVRYRARRSSGFFGIGMEYGVAVCRKICPPGGLLRVSTVRIPGFMLMSSCDQLVTADNGTCSNKVSTCPIMRP